MQNNYSHLKHIFCLDTEQRFKNKKKKSLNSLTLVITFFSFLEVKLFLITLSYHVSYFKQIFTVRNLGNIGIIPTIKYLRILLMIKSVVHL